MLLDILWNIGYYVVLVSGVAIIAILSWYEGWKDGYTVGKATKEDHNDR